MALLCEAGVLLGDAQRVVAIHEAGQTRSVGQVKTDKAALTLLGQSLSPTDRIAIETTGNARRIATILEPHVAGVMIVDTRNLKAITHAKLKKDRVDARKLAELLAAGMLPRRVALR